MRKGNSVLAGLALLATLALAIGLIAGPAAGAPSGNAGASGLQKCLKKAKKIKKKAKRKKRKKKCHAIHAPASPNSPKSLVRATLTWDSEPPGGGGSIDLDLWVFDSNGQRARAAANTIPNSSFTPNDVDAPGSEKFTDLAYTNPGGRNLSFGVCYQDGGSQHTTFKLDYVTADGVHHTASEEYGSDGVSSTFAGGAPIPANFCKA